MLDNMHKWQQEVASQNQTEKQAMSDVMDLKTIAKTLRKNLSNTTHHVESSCIAMSFWFATG